MKKILIEAAAVGNATARASVFRTRQKDAYLYPKSAWFVDRSLELSDKPDICPELSD